MNVRTFKKAVLIAVSLIIFASWVNVKEYQKTGINDSEMILGNRKMEKNELNIQSYREGASGTSGGKTGGGCGYN